MQSANTSAFKKTLSKSCKIIAIREQVPRMYVFEICDLIATFNLSFFLSRLYSPMGPMHDPLLMKGAISNPKQTMFYRLKYVLSNTNLYGVKLNDFQRHA